MGTIQWNYFELRFRLLTFLSRALATPLFGGAKPFVQFGRVHHEAQFYEINLNLYQQLRRCCLKPFLI